MKAELHIQTARRETRTYLKQAFFTPPFKVANITEDKRADPLKLMLMSSSPGVLDGDDYQLQIDLAEGCSLELQTQSYQRLFTMKQGASQRMHVQMEKGSSFCFLPHPSVPHEQSSFSATNQIYMTDGCCLIWGEVITCGRKLNGEVFQFSKYHTVTQVFINNKMVIKENVLITPATMNLTAIGQLEGFTHQASLIYLNEKEPVAELRKTIIAYLAQQTGILYGVSAAPVNGLVVRLLGQHGEQLHTCLKTIAGQLPQPTLRQSKSVAYEP
ncbi:urease accessory protein UreD [Spirosoma aureum]|uniref:Urease accessory protein UreD n=1 Tax=Spirosoma aureum TaxID=2692134 RepID=A0A6G9AJX6_9BACT|nr:urease accessory protein UreD [Spirosoma aureum]QIP12758.1 urease accessory protein UreD [Spirosoma aureum]